MRILGIDPGTRIAGYGVVDVRDGRVFAVAAGVWRLNAKAALHERLGQLCVEFGRAVDAFVPQVLCIEMAFVAANVRSAMALGHARGVILSQGALRGLSVHEISASAAKKAVVAHGQASKEHVACALERQLEVNFEGVPLDASDALAIAYAHARRELERARLGADAGALSKETAFAASYLGAAPKSSARKKERTQGFEVLLAARGGRA